MTKCQQGAKPVPGNSTLHFVATRKACTTGSCLAGSTDGQTNPHSAELPYLDGIANWGPRGPLRAGFGNSGWHDGWPQGLGSRLEATLQHHLPCREVWRLEAGCTAGRCWSLGLLQLRLRIRQRVHDGGGDGDRGQEVVRDLGKKRKKGIYVGVTAAGTAQHPALTDFPNHGNWELWIQK